MSVPAAVETVVTVADAARLSPPAIQGEPSWINSMREGACSWIAEHGFPTRQHEDWRYVDLRPLLESPVTVPEEPSLGLAREDIVHLVGEGLGGPRLILLNGRLSPELSYLPEVPVDVHLGSMAAAVQAGVLSPRDLSPQGGATFQDGFEALNAAFSIDGAFLEVAGGVDPGIPVEIVYLAVGGDQLAMSNPRTLIKVGSGATLTVVESYVGFGRGASFTNSRTNVLVGEGADVEHYRVQAESLESYHLSRVLVDPGRACRFASHLVATGSRLGRHELRASMGAAGATIELDGLYVTAGDQCHDNPVRLEHAAPNCTSRQLYKGIVDGSGRGVFNGHVIVHPGASGTDAHQVNKNLLLSDHAEVDTRPRLEIFSDDVACTHGAAVGQLDPDALFYLRSRGIAEPAARALLIAGFAEDVIDRFAQGPVRDRAEQLVAACLGTAVPEIASAKGGNA